MPPTSSRRRANATSSPPNSRLIRTSGASCCSGSGRAMWTHGIGRCWPLAPRTVGHAHRALRTALQAAAKAETLARNVAAVYSPPKVDDDEIEILDAAQVPVLLDAIAGHALGPIGSTGLATGCRRGELLALAWPCVDLDKASVRIERSLEQTRDKQAKRPSYASRCQKRKLGAAPCLCLRARWRSCATTGRRSLSCGYSMGWGRCPMTPWSSAGLMAHPFHRMISAGIGPAPAGRTNGGRCRSTVCATRTPRP